MTEEKQKIKWEDIEKPPMPDSTKVLIILIGVVNIIIFLIVLGM